MALEDWEKEPPDKVPAIIQRCPKCKNLSLEYNPETGLLKCTKCGFEEHLPQIKD